MSIKNAYLALLVFVCLFSPRGTKKQGIEGNEKRITPSWTAGGDLLGEQETIHNGLSIRTLNSLLNFPFIVLLKIIN